MNKIKGLLKLLRFELPFSAGVCVVMGQLLALGEFTTIPVTLFGFLSVFLISASILVMNDYFDVETDKINAPHRPIPSKLVTPNEALYFSLLLLFTGIILSYLINVSVTFYFNRISGYRISLQPLFQKERIARQPDGELFCRDDFHLRRCKCGIAFS